MVRLRAANNAETLLAESIEDFTSNFEVVSAADFPDPPFRCTIHDGNPADGEIIEVGAVSGNNFENVDRGMEDTDAQSWDEGDAVEQLGTAGMHNELVSEDEFGDHSAQHEDGGDDEINVAGLLGELADPQPPKEHGDDEHEPDYAKVAQLIASEIDYDDTEHSLGESYVQGVLDLLAESRIVEHNLDVADPANGYYVRWDNGLQVVMMESDVKEVDSDTFDVFDREPLPANFANILVRAPGGLHRTDGAHNFGTGHWPFSVDGTDRPDDSGRIRVSDAPFGHEISTTLLIAGTWS